MPEHTTQAEETFRPLDGSVKKRFPFPLGCPSFVYRAGYVENVRHLAPFVDEIQLLFFESRTPESLPAPALIRELRSLAVAQDISYNVHLPTDLFPAHPDPVERHYAAETLKQMLHCLAPLDPTTFTLHVNPNPNTCQQISLPRFQQYATETLEGVLSSGLPCRKISVENVADQLEKADPVIRELDLSVCMDVGHLMACNFDVAKFYRRWKDRISIVHLHGVDGRTDHLPLNRLSHRKMGQAMAIITRFNGPVTVEVYAHEALNASLDHLRTWFGIP